MKVSMYNNFYFDLLQCSKEKATELHIQGRRVVCNAPATPSPRNSIVPRDLTRPRDVTSEPLRACAMCTRSENAVWIMQDKRYLGNRFQTIHTCTHIPLNAKANKK